MRINGHYLDGKTSKRIPAVMEVLQTDEVLISLQLLDENNLPEKKRLAFDALNVSSRLGNTPREIGIGEGQLFVTEDNAAIDTLMTQHLGSDKHARLHRLETKLTHVAVAVVATMALLWTFVIYGIPFTAKVVANEMPSFATEKLGQGLNLLDQTLFDPSDISDKRQQEIRQLVAPYIAQYPDLHPKLNFRSGMRANALALPGGDIVFTDEFVRLAKNDEELLAVFFHELGHLEHKHITRRVLQDSMLTLMVVFIAGDLDTIDLVTGLPTLIVDLSYSREFEIEADTYALEQMHREHIPLTHFSSIMNRLEKLYDDDMDEEGTFKKIRHNTPDFLSTHPPTKDRVKLANQMIEKYKAGMLE